MKMNIGENLRKLRIRKDLTQEQLAEFFNVSPQAISRWENNSAYPDITALPGLANFYHISIDELIGMDEIRKAENLDQIFRQEHDDMIAGQVDQAIHMLQDAIKLYPDHNGLLSELALAITVKANEREDPEAIEQAITLSERVLRNPISAKLRSTTTVNLCFLYLKAGLHHQAEAVVQSLPHIWESREIVMPELYGGDEYIGQLKISARLAMTILCRKIKAAENRKFANVDNSLISGVEADAEADIHEMLEIIEHFFNEKQN
ncbi:MAG: helix-turn-helix transcriptional regulator [Clostridiaceae bacterium]|nr:helix-turn-helix transcriptional regulator [Clostridiaceae bacterium]